WKAYGQTHPVGVRTNRQVVLTIVDSGPDNCARQWSAKGDLSVSKDPASNDPALRRLALGTLLGAFRGETTPDWALDLVTQGVAGHVLFGYNIIERDQVAALAARVHAARDGVLLGIDEEGGDVTRLAHRRGSPYPGNAALGAVDDPEVTRRIYRA